MKNTELHDIESFNLGAYRICACDAATCAAGAYFADLGVITVRGAGELELAAANYTMVGADGELAFCTDVPMQFKNPSKAMYGDQDPAAKLFGGNPFDSVGFTEKKADR